MKKVLCLSLVASSMFSMQLDLVKQDSSPEKLSHHHINLKTGNITKLRSALVSTHELTPVDHNSLSKVCIDPKAFFVPESFGSVELYHSKKGFSIYQDGKKHVIQKCFSDPVLRNITREQLGAFLQVGYLSINRMDDGEFSLRAKGRVIGGGPAFGAFLYWATKSVGYGILAATAGTAVVTTGGAVVGAVAGTAVASSAVVGGGLALAGSTVAGSVVATAAATTVGATITGVGVATGVAVAGVTAGATAVATVAGATAVATAVAPTVAATVGAAAATGVTAGGIFAGIEAVAVFMGTLGGMAPTI